MTQFSAPWQQSTVRGNQGFVGKATLMLVGLLLVATLGYAITQGLANGHPVAMLVLVIGPLLSAAGVASAIMVFLNYRAIGQLLFRFALFILIGAVVSTAVGVWVINLLFEWVQTDLVRVADDPTLTSYFGAALTLVEIESAMSWAPRCLAALVWPLQFPLFRDLLSLGALVGLFNIIPVYLIWWERKVAGRIQSRLGPMRVGGWHGWAQTFADGIKLILKEDLVPGGADAPLFRIAPYFAVIPSLLAFLAMPFGLTYVFRELDVALVFVLAMLGIEVVAVILAGWASNNKWSVYGAMREACQMVAYEIPMGMALLVPVLCVGSLSLRVIGESQSGGWFGWLVFSSPFTFAAFIAYFVASLASCKRAPFDLPEAESELVAGFHTEYSGYRWSLFFFAEYAAMFIVCGLASILFLGGWNSPFPASWADGLFAMMGDSLAARGLHGLLFDGPIWLFLKCVFLLYVHIWLRWTLPRIRIDQVLYACVQVLLPFTMLLLFGTTIWVWASTSDNAAWATLTYLTNWALGLIGLAISAVFPMIAAYGFYNRRKLVGSLVQDAMPAS